MPFKNQTGDKNYNYGKLKVVIPYETLYKLYITDKRTLEQIAILYKVNKVTILNYLKRFGIPRRPTYVVKHSEETKIKMSNKRKGRKESEETLLKKSESLKKAYREGRHPNWKGGITKENASVRGSLKYKKWRKLVFERDKYICQKCGDKSRKGNPVVLNAHHIKPFSKFKENRFDIENGVTLCKNCHAKIEKERMIGNTNGKKRNIQ